MSHRDAVKSFINRRNQGQEKTERKKKVFDKTRSIARCKKDICIFGFLSTLMLNYTLFDKYIYIGIREDPIRFQFIIRLPRQGILALSRLTFLYLVRFEDLWPRTSDT
jgi:hypothetical protein